MVRMHGVMRLCGRRLMLLLGHWRRIAENLNPKILIKYSTKFRLTPYIGGRPVRRPVHGVEKIGAAGLVKAALPHAARFWRWPRQPLRPSPMHRRCRRQRRPVAVSAVTAGGW
jgi:hypothetical protein